MSPDLRTLPAIRALAEREAREHFDAVASALSRTTGLVTSRWAALTPNERDVCTDGRLDLLCDLTRASSRDAVARLVAEKIGLECGATAPSLWRMGVNLWAFAYMTDSVDGVKNGGVWFTPGEVSGATRIHSVPDLDGITGPAEALRLIALAVLA